MSVSHPPNESSAALLLSIDGGQTSTKALIAQADGTILGAGTGGPTVHYHAAGGPEKNRTSIHEATQIALAASDTSAEAVVSVGLGITGVVPDGEEAPIIRAIIKELLDPASIMIETDTVTSLLGASGGRAGVVVISGGGAIGYGQTEDGRVAVSNGQGYWLGDEGGAFWIGMRAIDAASRASDKRGDPTSLQRVVLDHFEIERMRELPRIVYRADFRRDRISQLTPAVVEVAKSGDPAALRILKNASRELALTAAGVIRQLNEHEEPVVVFPVGGVFGERKLVREPFEAEVAQLCSAARVENPRFPPAVGGLILAARAIDIAIDEAWLGKVEASMP